MSQSPIFLSPYLERQLILDYLIKTTKSTSIKCISLYRKTRFFQRFDKANLETSERRRRSGTGLSKKPINKEIEYFLTLNSVKSSHDIWDNSRSPAAAILFPRVDSWILHVTQLKSLHFGSVGTGVMANLRVVFLTYYHRAQSTSRIVR